jgi:hypothetical protein
MSPSPASTDSSSDEAFTDTSQRSSQRTIPNQKEAISLHTKWMNLPTMSNGEITSSVVKGFKTLCDYFLL